MESNHSNSKTTVYGSVNSTNPWTKVISKIHAKNTVNKTFFNK